MTDALRTHECRAAGPNRHQREGPGWEQVSHGLYTPYGTRLILPTHASALARVLPADAAFGHVTGAALRGWPLPWLPDGLPLFASTGGQLHVQRNGSYVRRVPFGPPDTVGALPVVGVAHHLVDLARDLELVDLVPVVDAALRSSELTAADVLGGLRPRMHGLPRLRRALALADPRSESFWESVLRLLHVLGGISAVEAQHWVDDARTIRGDLWLVDTRRIVEYDGAEHRSAPGHRRDLTRDKKIRRLGWERYAYVAQDIVSSPGRILRDAEAGLGLRHEPARLRRWLAYARRSTLTGEGKARLERRLARYVLAAERPDRQPC